MRTLLWYAGQAVLGVLFLICLLATAIVVVIGTLEVSRDMSLEDTAGAIRVAIYASVALAVIVLLGGLSLRGIWVLQRRGAAQR